MILAIGLIVIVAIVVWASNSRSEWTDIAGPVALILVVVWLACAIAAIVNQMGFRPAMSKMAQVRSSVARLGCSASEDVIGAATDWNAETESNRIWNGRFITDPFYHDGWDTVTTIVIPECK